MEERGQHQIKLDPSLAADCVSPCDEIGIHRTEKSDVVDCLVKKLFWVKRIMVIQKDGKNFVGNLGSVDHFGNLFLCKAVERICVGGRNGKFGDIPVGAILVRGDSVSLTCEIDPVLEQRIPMEKVSVEEILGTQQKENKIKEEKDKQIAKGLKERGILYPYRHSREKNGFTED